MQINSLNVVTQLETNFCRDLESSHFVFDSNKVNLKTLIQVLQLEFILNFSQTDFVVCNTNINNNMPLNCEVHVQNL